MERSVIFRSRQGVLPEDFNRPQDAMRDSIDHVVRDGILDGYGWSDFTAMKTGTAEVTVSVGRIYNGGAVYATTENKVIDLVSQLPIANSKWVAIVGFGKLTDTDVQARNYLINAVTRETQPDQVPMLRLRECVISTVVSVEAPQPAKPLIDVNNVLIAWVLITPTGVSTIELVEGNRVPNTFREKLRTDELFEWKALIGPQIESLKSDLAAIKALLAQRGDAKLVQAIAVDVARVKEALELEDGHTSYDADRFLDNTETANADVNLNCKIEEGIRFSDEAANLVSLQVFNPVNPDVIISNGFCLPKFTEVEGFSIGPFSQAIPISQYQFQELDMVQRTVARQRIRYGETLTICTNNAWFRAGHYDSTKKVLTRDGETWELIQGNGSINHTSVRLRRFWVDAYEEVYWNRVTVDRTITGSQIAQTFLNGADRWLSSIGLRFTQKSATGNVDIALCLTKYGQPDLENVITTATLDVANILTSGDGSIVTKVKMPATFLEAGKRYAIVITSGGNHYVGMASGTQYAQGTFFFSVDGAYQSGTPNIDLMFSLYFAKFSRSRTVVDMAAMSLSGGIAAIDILAPMILPGSCDLAFEVQVAGEWTPLAEITGGNTALFTLPPLLPFRAIFNGTTDVQAGINLAESQLKYNRPRTVLKHISKEYTLDAGTQSFKVIALLENYKEANHNLSCTIRKNGAGSEIAPASVVDEEMDPPADPRSALHKRIKRTFTWTSTQITTPMTVARITLDGATTSALDTWHVAERVHLAF